MQASVRGRARSTSDAVRGVSRSLARSTHFFFCPRCGATVYFWAGPEHIAVLVGAFADPNFPAPRVSVWEDCMHPWVGLPNGIEHIG